MSFEIDRRKFLRFAAGGAAGAATSGIGLTGISSLNAALAAEQVRVPGGKESWAPSICTLCPGGCGLRVRLIGKRAVKVQGNPSHPVNRGRLCPKGLALLQELYHPDRLRKPLHNTGSRDNPRWKQVSWDEALNTIGRRLQDLRVRGKAQSVAVVDRPSSGLLSRLLRQFMSAYGSSNYFVMPSGLDGAQAALQLQQGIDAPVAYDFGNSRYVLSFGVNLLEGWGAPVAIMRAFAQWREAASGRRTKLVQVEPRLSITAGRADEWVPIRPGTEASLALGIAYALISEGLYDADFVRDHTFGFEDWHDAEGNSHLGFRSLVTNEYRLNDVAAITRVPADTILRLAREAAQNRPAIALGPCQSSLLPGDTYSSMAVHSLNALLGSVDVPGGVLVQQKLPSDATEQAAPRSAAGSMLCATELPDAILSARGPSIEAVLLNQTNPLLALPNGREFKTALSKVPFVVSMTSFMDDTAAMADYVLPLATGLESWQDCGPLPTVANALLAISPPAVQTRFEVKHAGDVVLALARAVGGPAAGALPFSDYETYLKAQVKRVFAAQSGTVFGSTLEDTWNRMLERSGWWSPSYSSADELWDQVLQQGGWWEPTYSYGEWSRVLRTASGKFEFYVQPLGQAALNGRNAASISIHDADHACLPHQPALPETTSNFPLLLIPVETLPLSGNAGAHLPYLQQIAGEHLFASWDSWLEIHPETARQFGIVDGDTVWVESRLGRVQARARLFEGARPGVVHLPLGYGSTVGSAWACRGANPYSIGEVTLDAVTNRPIGAGTSVKVYKA